MPNFLCFTDPSLALLSSDNKSASNCRPPAKAEPPAGDDCEEKSSTSADADSIISIIEESSSLDDKHHGSTFNIEQRPKATTILFKHDEDKKQKSSSFSLQHPYALVSEVQVWHHKKPSNDEEGQVEFTHEHIQERHDDTIHNDDGDIELASYSALVATSSITSSSLLPSDTSDTCLDDKQQLETFLFGGFEVVANVRIVEVYVVRSENNCTSNNKTSGNGNHVLSAGEERDTDTESYLTKCHQGTPVSENDLTPLEGMPSYTDGSMPLLSSSKDNTASCDDKYYKFSYTLPGGPKPMKKVILKFVSIAGESADHDNHESSSMVIVRALNVKGRLKGRRSDSRTIQEPTDSVAYTPPHHQQSTSRQNGVSEIRSSDPPLSSGVLQNGVKGNAAVHNIAHIAALQQQIRKLQEDQLEQARQLPSELHMRKQSEIISKIPGINLFIRPFEELTTSKAEKMFEDMEKRIMGRLDGIVDRLEGIEEKLGGIEQSLKETGVSTGDGPEQDASTEDQNNALDGLDEMEESLNEETDVATDVAKDDDSAKDQHNQICDNTTLTINADEVQDV